MNKLLSFSLLLLFPLLAACQPMGEKKSNPNPNAATYQRTVLPSDTTKLFIGDGDLTKDTVMIIGEGGPKSVLDFDQKGRCYWEYYAHQKEYYFAVVHQSSTYNPSIFPSTNFTLEDADYEVGISSEILFRTIKYFKDRNKFVIVYGHSYSAFLVPHCLSKYPALADRYVVTGGRLNSDSLQTAYQLKGINTGFKEDGVTLELPENVAQPNPFRRQRYVTIRSNKEKLKYALGKTRFTEALAKKDLSKLVFYYGLHDQNVGALSAIERQFLEDKKATVVAVPAGHYDLWKKLIPDVESGVITW